MHNIMGICVQHHANISKQTTLLDGIDVGPPKWHICGCGLNRSVHLGMSDVPKRKIHRKCKYTQV